MKEKILKNKKYLVICSLFFCLTVGLTLAWASVTGNNLTNRFTIGSIETDIDEKDPAVDNDHIDKAPYVKNTGKNPALVRMRVTISPSELKSKYQIDLTYNDVPDKYQQTNDEDPKQTNACWKYNEEDDFWYYTALVQPNEKTEPLFTEVIGEDIIDEKNSIKEELEGLEITIYHDSIQNVARKSDGSELKVNTGDIGNQDVKDLWKIFDTQKQ